MKPNGSWTTQSDSGRFDYGTIEVINPDTFIAYSSAGAILWTRVKPKQ